MKRGLIPGLLAGSWPSWALAALVTASAQLLIWLQPSGGGDGRGLDILLVLAATVPLVWTARWPLLSFGVSGAAALLHVGLGYQNPFPVTFAVLAALFCVAAFSRLRWALASAAAVALALPLNFAITWHTAGHVTLGDIPYNYGLFAAAFILGDDVRQRRARVAELQDRAARLEADRSAAERRAAELERQRIARELHDTIGHHLSVMVLQAGAARRVAAGRPEQAAEVLDAIERTGRQALAEVRRLLGMERPPLPESALAPQPGLADLDQLVAQVANTGLMVQLQVEGRRRPLPPSLELSAYRIVQEALTNTLRHAGARSAAVTVRFDDHALGLTVADDGDRPARANGGGGQGLVGMRERAALFGGRLDAGPQRDGGFRVVASLPLGPAP
ncbi:MAG TPA: sensor histidine kinase [Candidatus Micrarchaeia archaeon]|nr:sensor histidine kinase [Candidatus Micrarchaeia archaeon]